MLITDETLLAEIDRFLGETEMKETRFGMDAMGDGALVKQLRAGRSLSLKNAAKVMQFMAEYRPQVAA